jgi:peptidoglycan/LPS O-acetylase OafA/YrhL
MIKALSVKRELSEVTLGGHIPALDALRGFAVLLVMIGHFSHFAPLPVATVSVDLLFSKVAGIGWVGVDLFFVLSGFLITGILYDSKAGAHYFRSFYARRVLRIFPLYYGCLVVFLIVLPRLFPGDGALRSLHRDAFWYWTYLLNLKIAYHGFPSIIVLAHFWTLAIEEQFYLVWPAVIFLFRRSSLIRICLLCIAGAFVARVTLMVFGYDTAAYVLTPARIDALAVGAALALASRGPAGFSHIARLAPRAAATLTILLAAVAVTRGGLAPWDPVMKTIGHTLLACLFGAVLVLAVTSTRQTFLGRVFSSPSLRFFGRYSYALYVIHPPLLIFKPGVLPLDWVPTIFGSLLLRKLVFMMSATAVSVGLAMISWHMYEKQFMKLKRLFPYEVAKGEVDQRRSEFTLIGAHPARGDTEVIGGGREWQIPDSGSAGGQNNGDERGRNTA